MNAQKRINIMKEKDGPTKRTGEEFSLPVMQQSPTTDRRGGKEQSIRTWKCLIVRTGSAPLHPHESARKVSWELAGRCRIGSLEIICTQITYKNKNLASGICTYIDTDISISV